MYSRGLAKRREASEEESDRKLGGTREETRRKPRGAQEEARRKKEEALYVPH